MRRATLGRAVGAALAALGVLLVDPVHAGTAATVTPLGHATLAGERAYAATFSVAPDLVKRLGQIPGRWFQALQRDSSGRATVGLSLVHGTFTAFGRTHPTTYIDLWVVLDPSKIPLPERTFDTSSIMGSHADFYFLQLAGDGGWARWLTTGGIDLGPYVRAVPGMHEVVTGTGLDTFAFTAPEPYPLKMVQTATQPIIPVAGGFHNNWWRATGRGTWRMDDLVPTATVGQFKDWSLTTSATTPLGQLVGQHTAASCVLPTLAGGQVHPGGDPLAPLLTAATGQFGLGCSTALTGGAPTTLQTELISGGSSASQ